MYVRRRLRADHDIAVTSRQAVPRSEASAFRQISPVLRRALAAFAWLNVAVSLVVRVVHRGPYVPGWDFVGAAHGLFLASTRSPRAIVSYLLEHQFDTAFTWILTALSVLPGFLAARWPSAHWPLVTVLLFSLLAFALLGAALRLERTEWWLVTLGCAASSAILSNALMGNCHIEATLPFAIALCATLRCRATPLAATILAALAIEAAWHVHELGRTVFAVFLAAAVCLPHAQWSARAVWAAAGLLQLWLALRFVDHNTAHLIAMRFPPPATWAGYARDISVYFLSATPDIPLLLVAALLALMLVRGDRWFWRAIVGFQMGLVWLLVTNSGVMRGLSCVWPRRILVLEFLCLGLVVAVIRERHRAARVMLGLLVAGAVWQLAHTLRWAARPLDPTGTRLAFTLPYTETTMERGAYLDSKVSFSLVDWSVELRSRAEQGRRLLLVYNLSSFDENNTDPAGVLERLYLHLGHARFLDTVFSFGAQRVRWNELPIRPMNELDGFLGSLTDPSIVDGYWLHHPNDEQPTWESATTHRQEVATIFGKLGERFQIVWGLAVKDLQGRTLHRFALAPRSG